MIARLLAASARWVLAHRRATVLGLVAVSAAALVALRSFRINHDIASLFPRGDAELDLLAHAGLSTESGRTMFVILRGEELDERLAEVIEGLEASPLLAEVRADKESFGGERAQAARNAPLYFLPEETLLALEQRLTTGRKEALADSKRLLAEDPALGREIVQRDPLGLRWILEGAARSALPQGFDFASPYLLFDQGKAALLLVRGTRDPFDVAYSRELVADVSERLTGFEIELLGGYAIACQDAARIRADLESSIWWSLPLLILFLIFSTRSFYLAHVMLLPVLVAVLWALGFGGLLLGPLTPLAVSGAAILMGLGIDFAIHYCERYQQERRTRTHAAAIVETQRETGRVLLYGMATSVAAFLSLGLGAFSSLEGFGLLLALGLFCSWLVTLLCLPLLLGRRAETSQESPARIWLWLEGFSARRAGRLCAGLFAALTLGAWGSVALRGIRFDADPNHLRPEHERLDLQFARLGEQLGFSPLSILAFVPAETALDVLEKAERDLLARGELALVDGPQHRSPSMERRERVALFHERTAGWLDECTFDLSALGFRAEAFRSTLEEWRGRFEKQPEGEFDDVRLRWQDRDYWRLSFHPRQHAGSAEERARLRNTIARALPPESHVIDPGGLSDRIGPLLASNLTRSAAISALIVAALALVAIKNWRASLVALTPVTAGLGITLAFAGLCGWPLHPGNFIAIPLILGLGVDDGLHMVLRAKEGSQRLIVDTGAAVWRTTATTCLGFGSLISADSPALASMGALVLAGMLACFLASILLVPVLWKRL